MILGYDDIHFRARPEFDRDLGWICVGVRAARHETAGRRCF